MRILDYFQNSTDYMNSSSIDSILKDTVQVSTILPDFHSFPPLLGVFILAFFITQIIHEFGYVNIEQSTNKGKLLYTYMSGIINNIFFSFTHFIITPSYSIDECQSVGLTAGTQLLSGVLQTGFCMPDSLLFQWNTNILLEDAVYYIEQSNGTHSSTYLPLQYLSSSPRMICSVDTDCYYSNKCIYPILHSSEMFIKYIHKNDIYKNQSIYLLSIHSKSLSNLSSSLYASHYYPKYSSYYPFYIPISLPTLFQYISLFSFSFIILNIFPWKLSDGAQVLNYLFMILFPKKKTIVSIIVFICTVLSVILGIILIQSVLLSFLY
ncbi:hypothetical protein WA158_007433 [Blastocystis sp. Blastoise]